MKARIYTKTGDKGFSSLVGGERVPKTHPRLEAYGTVDELNSAVGLLRAKLKSEIGPISDDLRGRIDDQLRRIQNALFDIGSRLACSDPSLRESMPQLKPDAISQLEREMDQWEAELDELTGFILPGGSVLGAQAHVVRTICRRAERHILGLGSDAVDSQHSVYMNRLSDWLFLLARKFNQATGTLDHPWTK